ncbi:hypothetical protein [Spiroplasma endosymbiont of Glossina fuscipes fuscipes]|uniref:hypothetical protein n=1 Tax=Spiroplasma endosymbiont of Glossina fuscipes fuscipes TaxID=2004463 RepID=UPI003C72C1A0
MLLRKRKQDNLTVIKSKKPILKQGLEQFIAYYFKKIQVDPTCLDEFNSTLK